MNVSSFGSSVKRFVCAGALTAGVVFSLASGDAMAATSSETQWEPIGWRTCMRTTAYYHDWIWEASNNPDPGVDYDAIIADAKAEMDSACNRVLMENNLPTR
jgi:hypothetical protein